MNHPFSSSPSPLPLIVTHQLHYVIWHPASERLQGTKLIAPNWVFGSWWRQEEDKIPFHIQGRRKKKEERGGERKWHVESEEGSVLREGRGRMREKLDVILFPLSCSSLALFLYHSLTLLSKFVPFSLACMSPNVCWALSMSTQEHDSLTTASLQTQHNIWLREVLHKVVSRIVIFCVPYEVPQNTV